VSQLKDSQNSEKSPTWSQFISGQDPDQSQCMGQRHEHQFPCPLPMESYRHCCVLAAVKCYSTECCGPGRHPQALASPGPYWTQSHGRGSPLCGQSSFLFAAVGIELRASSLLGKAVPLELCPQSSMCPFLVTQSPPPVEVKVKYTTWLC
jgi:hypothetical protein